MQRPAKPCTPVRFRPRPPLRRANKRPCGAFSLRGLWATCKNDFDSADAGSQWSFEDWSLRTAHMMINDTLLCQQLQAFEVELHKPAARSDVTRLDALLHPDFQEFGRSGNTYTKADILVSLPTEAHATIVADCFKLRRLADNVALLTYRSAHRLVDGKLDRFSLRVTVWQRTDSSWQMRFHQGTPTTPYELEYLNEPHDPADGTRGFSVE
jgi:hypothetical protein